MTKPQRKMDGNTMKDGHKYNESEMTAENANVCGGKKQGQRKNYTLIQEKWSKMNQGECCHPLRWPICPPVCIREGGEQKPPAFRTHQKAVPVSAP